MRRFVLPIRRHRRCFGADCHRLRAPWLGQLRRRQSGHRGGPIQTLKFENPHAEITVKGADKVWTVTLAPTFRMTSRGATADVVAVGKTVSAYGYPSTVEKDEMRAERITVDGKTYELR